MENVTFRLSKTPLLQISLNIDAVPYIPFLCFCEFLVKNRYINNLQTEVDGWISLIYNPMIVHQSILNGHVYI